MCGINAIYSFNQLPVDAIYDARAMSAQMVYRGPDSTGDYEHPNTVLSMRRLSIVDVQGGDQPLYNEDKSLVVICNGEIYNYVELKQQLEQRGHHFATRSDAETILHLYEEKGESCLDDLRGMYAFVLWDIKRNKIFAARDRFGQKPLYYYQRDGILWLSSELKAIVRAARITSPTIRPEALYQFLWLTNPVDQRNTIVEQIKRILPAEYIVADATGVRFQRYWHPKFGGVAGIADYSDTDIEATLAESVNIHLRSDVPVGILLSSGVDSSAIAALAAKTKAKDNLTCICVGYKDNPYADERAQAHRTAQYLGLPYKDVMIDESQYVTHFNELVNYCDEPVGDVAASSHWELYHQAYALGYKVLLSGTGGDEVFFGYAPHNKIGASHSQLTSTQFQKWIWYQDSLPTQMRERYVKQIAGTHLSHLSSTVYQPIHDLQALGTPGPDAVAATLLWGYTVHSGLQLGDKLGMGNSVEIRVPFLDHPLVDKVIGLPLARRFSLETNKPLLKKILRGKVPDTVLDAKKRPFSPPRNYVSWILNQSLDELEASPLIEMGFLDRKQWRDLCAKYRRLKPINNQPLRYLLGLNGQLNWVMFCALSVGRWWHMIKNFSKY